MYSTGIVRVLDGLGRIVIPKEMRRQMHLEAGSKLEMLIDEQNIILREFALKCSVCGKEKCELHNFQKAVVCSECLSKLQK